MKCVGWLKTVQTCEIYLVLSYKVYFLMGNVAIIYDIFMNIFSKMLLQKLIKNIKKLMESLVTNEKLEELLKSFQDEIVKTLNINEQNTKIEELKSKLAIKQIAIDNLEIKCEGSERYSGRSSLRIHGLDFDSDEDNNVTEKLEKSYRHMGIEFNRNEMDRARYISKSFIDKKEKRKVRSIIIKFRSWGSRTTFYKARPKNHSD